jgi:hypothetical protein
MRKAPNKLIEKHRLTIEKSKKPHKLVSDSSYGNNGLFIIKRKNLIYSCIASDTKGWDHVSVSINTGKDFKKNKLPTWEEMCWIKELFWEDEEEVIQIHPRKSQYINVHPHVLHLWRPQEKNIPLPPINFV